jgi:hypothetical protein
MVTQRVLHPLVGGKPACEWEGCENTASHGLETSYGHFGLWYLCPRHVLTIRLPQKV